MPLRICGIPELVDETRPPVSHVVSLLDPAEPLPSVLAGWPEPRRHLFRVDDIVLPLPGYVLPDAAFVDELLATLQAIERDTPSRLLIHCHAGRSRSTATALMWLAQREAVSAGALAERLLAGPPLARPARQPRREREIGLALCRPACCSAWRRSGWAPAAASRRPAVSCAVPPR